MVYRPRTQANIFARIFCFLFFCNIKGRKRNTDTDFSCPAAWYMYVAAAQIQRVDRIGSREP